LIQGDKAGYLAEYLTRIKYAGNHEERHDRRLRTGSARRLRMRIQLEEERFPFLGLSISQRWPNQRDAIRANAGAESAKHGGYAEEFEQVIDTLTQ